MPIPEDGNQRVGPVKLLVMQGTPFCNIDCRYCYLPDRSNKGRMSVDTVRATVARLSEGPYVKTSMLVNWHAGEPLVLPPEFYSQRIPLFGSLEAAGAKIEHSLQTNAMLVNDAFCKLFHEYEIKIGVSIDGPAFIHDAQRLTRSGKGTHSRCIDGVKRLQDRQVPFNVICVLSDLSVRHPDEMYEFFRDLGVRAVAFNVEEIEGANTETSISAAGFEDRWRAFLERFWKRVEDDGQRIRIREFDDMQARILDRKPRRNSQTEPFINLSVAWNGDYSTFCPELLGLRFPNFPTFSMGNVHETSLSCAGLNEPFGKVNEEIQLGVEACRSECDYFAVCAGGNPANKISENGSFRSTETMNCRARIKVMADFVIEKLETKIRSTG